MTKRLKVEAMGPNGRFMVRGQTAKALLSLIATGPKGRTAQEVASWAYRFAAYCHELRKHGLVIETMREAHTGGWHGRHVLHSPVQIISIDKQESDHGAAA